MKQYLILILFFLYYTPIFSQYTDSVKKYLDFYEHPVKKNSKDRYLYSIARKTTDGKWHVKNYYTSTGTLYMEGMYLDNELTRPEGQFYFYHPNGQLNISCTYNECSIVGLYTEYNKQGIIIDSSRWKSSGIPYHKCYIWNDTGVLIYYGDFDNSGSGAGYETLYYPGSGVSESGKYVAGALKDSVWTYYYKNGNVSCIENYDSGQVINCECFTTLGIKQDNCDTAYTNYETGYNVGYYLREKFDNTRLKRLLRKHNYPAELNLYMNFIVNEEGKVDIEMIEDYPEEVYSLLRTIYQSLPTFKPARHKNRPIVSVEEEIVPLKLYRIDSKGKITFY